jgi:CheY-like chemotaxis protein
MPTKGRILVVDDEEIVRDVAGEMLSLANYRVNYAANGSEGISHYKHALDDDDCYDAVLMDIDMPGRMNGLDATHVILSMDPGARVILSSGNHYEDLQVEYKIYGFSGTLPKPYGMIELVEVLDNLLLDKVA